MGKVKKYIIILLIGLLAACCLAGLSTWIVTDTIEVGNPPQYKDYSKKLYLKNRVEYNYDPGGLDLNSQKDKLFVDEGGYDVILENGVTIRATISDGATTTSTVSVGGTYKVTVAVNNQNGGPGYEIAGYYDVDSSEIIPDESPTAILKYKSVDVGGTLYTIEDALNKATNKQTATVKYNTSFAVKDIADLAGYSGDGYYTVKSGATLLLPYDGEKEYNSTVTSGSSSFGNADKLKIKLTLPQNITLTNNGTTTIGGITTGAQNYAGGTVGDYAQITLGGNAGITSTGTINSYGFIVEETSNNGSFVTLTSGSLKMPFIVIEHRGGTIFSNINDNMQGSPFNRFYMENVTAKLTVNYGATLYGHANLYAGSRDNTTDINLIGNTSSRNEKSFFQLSNGSRLEAKFDSSTKVTEWDVYGSMDINSLELQVKVSIVTVPISTSKIMFPVSWYYHYNFHTLENGVAAKVTSSTQKIKILPGGAITVDKDVTLAVPQIFIYDEKFVDPQDGTVSAASYEKAKGAGKLLVNGVLEAQQAGGFVDTTEDDAKINISTDAHTQSFELRSIKEASPVWEQYDKYLELKIYNSKMDSLSDYALNQSKSGEQTFTSKNGGWMTDSFYIEYKANGDERGGVLSGNANDEYSGHEITGNTIKTDAPKREYHTFTGWYYDAGCLQKVGAESKSVSAGEVVTVYAGWDTITYTLSFEIAYLGNGYEEVTDLNLTWKYGDNVTLPDLSERLAGFEFSGWFIDSNYSKGITEITNDNIDNLEVSDRYDTGEITIYSKFVQGGLFSVQYDNSDRYTNELVGSANALPTDQTGTIGSAVAEIANATEIIEKIDDYNHEYYFTGWKSKQSGKMITEAEVINESDLTNGVLILVAQWEQKAKIMTKISIGTMSSASITITEPVNVTASDQGVYYFQAGQEITVNITLGGVGQTRTAAVAGAASGNFQEKNSVKDKKFTMPGPGKQVTITASATGTCLVEGTLVTLADGTQKPVEDLLPTDEVLVFNHYTGEYDGCELWSNIHAGNAADWYTITYLKFSDGTELGINYEHGLYDKTLNKYVYITNYNAQQYVGHSFVKVNNVNGKYVSSEVTLTGWENVEEYVRVFSPASLFHMNIVTNSLLTVTAWPCNSSSFENYFAFDEDMKYDEEAMQADIERYGLYTYEDFKDLMTEDLFNALPWKYFKIAVGKGMMTWEDILYTIEWIYTTGQIQLD